MCFRSTKQQLIFQEIVQIREQELKIVVQWQLFTTTPTSSSDTEVTHNLIVNPFVSNYNVIYTHIITSIVCTLTIFASSDNLTEALMFLSHFFGDIHQVFSTSIYLFQDMISHLNYIIMTFYSMLSVASTLWVCLRPGWQCN